VALPRDQAAPGVDYEECDARFRTRIASLLKRWLLGTHQGAVSSKHLDYYLDEYTFRLNRRTSRARGLLFYRLMHTPATASDAGLRGRRLVPPSRSAA
jgi:hypothetical protein